MKIATFNINGVNTRLAGLLQWLESARPDVCCLQELKATDAQFPAAAILAVPTAIAGIYGMNFEHMPELDSPYGYWIVLAVIAAICLTLYVRFKRTRWL